MPGFIVNLSSYYNDQKEILLPQFQILTSWDLEKLSDLFHYYHMAILCWNWDLKLGVSTTEFISNENDIHMYLYREMHKTCEYICTKYF